MTDIWSIANQKQQRRDDDRLLRFEAIDRTLIDRDIEVDELKQTLFETRVLSGLIILILLVAVAKLAGDL